MEILTETEVRVLTEARFVLQALAHGFDGVSVMGRANEQLSEGWSRDHDVRGIARSEALADVADDAIFGVLNALTNHLHDPLATRDIHVKRPPVETPFGPLQAVEDEAGAS